MSLKGFQGDGGIFKTRYGGGKVMDSSTSSIFTGSAFNEREVVIDVATLQASTMGELWLQIEVVSHFARQIDDVLSQLTAGQARDGWRMIAHTLRGTAAAIGAMELLEIAEDWEDGGLGAREADRADLISRIERAMPRFEGALLQISDQLYGAARASRKNQ